MQNTNSNHRRDMNVTQKSSRIEDESKTIAKEDVKPEVTNEFSHNSAKVKSEE